MEMATCIIDSKTLPQIFSAEAIKCAPYIQNRVPHKHIDGITRFESCSGNKHDMSHFQFFGFKVWARIPLEKRRDLEPQSQECVFVGYS